MNIRTFRKITTFSNFSHFTLERNYSHFGPLGPPQNVELQASLPPAAEKGRKSYILAKIEKITKFHEMRKSIKSAQKLETALFASQTANEPVAQGKVDVLGAHFAKRWGMTKSLDCFTKFHKGNQHFS